MDNLNYFSILCFLWAFIGIGSRIFMVTFGQKWIDWELQKAYSEEKPKWIYLISITSLIIITYTWYRVFTTDIEYSWIITVLLTLTLIKVFNLLFNYNQFRKFVKLTLNNKKKLRRLNIGVVVYSIVAILMGLFLY